MGVGQEASEEDIVLDALDVLTRSAALFGEVLNGVTDEDLALPTTRDDWTVEALVANHVLGDAVAKDAMEGIATGPVTEFDPKILGSSPITTWRGTALAMIAAFSVDGALETEVAFGGADLTGRQLLAFRASDSLVAAWDLANAIGQPIDLPADLAEFALDSWLPYLQELDNPSFIGDGPLTPAADATPGERLLALMGRAL